MIIQIKKDGQVVKTKNYRKTKVGLRFMVWTTNQIRIRPLAYKGWSVEIAGE